MIKKFKIGKYLVPVEITTKGDRWYFKFGYNKELISRIKSFDGIKWHGFDDPPVKVWSCKINRRNKFTLAYYCGEPVYAKYDQPLINIGPLSRPVKAHQVEMISHGLTMKQCILAAEMGTGKTLAAIEIMERSKIEDWFYVSNKSGIKAVQLEMDKWKCKIIPKYFTYEAFVKFVENYVEGSPLPKGIIFDESSKLKTPSTIRVKAVLAIMDQFEKQHGEDFYCILMSGSPAPKAPTDWWSQCEVAKPGFISEPNIHAFRNRLAIIKEGTDSSGATFPQIIGWKDDKRLCLQCGRPETADEHTFQSCMYQPAENEVGALYKRLKGFVLVKKKKDCLELPDKQYVIKRFEVASETKRLASIVKSQATRAIQAMTWLRELSDGFQYTDKPTGEKIFCDVCHGSGEITVPETDICPRCYGEGKIDVIIRTAERYFTPKDDELIDDLDAHEDIGRFVIYAGFTDSVDKIVGICKQEGWSTIRVDGRGWNYTDVRGNYLGENHLKDFQECDGKIAFVGQADSAGMGITLTRSPTIVFYSNTFRAESRIQAEDRIHRMGMDINRGATIKDYIHLPIDEYILTNLKNKRRLQDLSLGEIPV